MVTTSFHRVLTLLRKERGISQKEAAASLKISQALLSHYERGIRECGLEFVVRVADFYGVSCDYLLGRTADKSGATISVEEIPEGDANEDQVTGSTLPILNKKLILNAVNLLFGLLQRYDSKDLTTEVTAYLNLAVYTVFRALYGADNRNPAALFDVPKKLYQPAAAGAMSVGAARITLLAPEALQHSKVPALSPKELTKVYPLFSASLLALLKSAENRLGNI